MPTLEEMISVLLPIVPDAQVTLDNDNQIVIYTGINQPADPADGL